MDLNSENFQQVEYARKKSFPDRIIAGLGIFFPF